MSRVKSKDTSPEMTVRRLVYGMGYRYRLHDKRLPGKPDLAFLGRRKVIFVNGCFWHGHDGCRYARLPKTRVAFWKTKIEKNRARDDEIASVLRADGWKVLTLWQCEIKNIEELESKLYGFIEHE